MGADINSKMFNDLSVMHCASQSYAWFLSMIVLKDFFNFDVNIKDIKKATPLHFATIYREIKNVELLIKYGANVDA